MKALFLYFGYFPEHSGVYKKIQSQIKSLERSGFETVLFGSQNEQGDMFIGDTIIGPRMSLRKIGQQVAFFTKIVTLINDYKISFIYYRFNGAANPYEYIFFSRLKKMGIKMVMEIPTYPYDGEIASKNGIYYLDKLCRIPMAKKFDYVVTFSDLARIFSQKTINISNGIDFNAVPLKNNIEVRSHELNLLGVANLTSWHGYDRIICGLSEYYNTANNDVKVKLHLVTGLENDCVMELKQLVSRLKLERYVYFHGELHGKALDKLFDEAQVAIGSLGRHRNNITQLKTLKNVEYAARGIPFIYSEINEDFDDASYVMRIKADDSPVNIPSIIEFYQHIQASPINIRASIASLSWDNQIEKVVNKVFNR